MFTLYFISGEEFLLQSLRSSVKAQYIYTEQSVGRFCLRTRISGRSIYILFCSLIETSVSNQTLKLQVRKQHLLRTVDFLVDELKVCATRAEAEQRVFFVSAKEVLQARINGFKRLPINSNLAFRF